MRTITLEDCELLADIYGKSFTKGWNEQQFIELLNGGAQGWLIEGHTFILLRCAADEAEIITLATHPDFRRKGYADKIIAQMIEQLKIISISKLFLEVRADNIAAIKLYKKHGFSQTAIRPNYYAMPDGTRKDAIIMCLELDKAA